MWSLSRLSYNFNYSQVSQSLYIKVSHFVASCKASFHSISECLITILPWKEGSVLWQCEEILTKIQKLSFFQFSRSVMSNSVPPWTAACLAFLSITNSQSLIKLMSIASVMPSNHLILCHPLLFLPSIFPSIRVFSDELALCIRWPKYWSFSFNISPSNEHSGLIFFRISFGLISLQCKGLSRLLSNTTVQKHHFFGAQLSLWSNSHIHTWLLEKP